MTQPLRIAALLSCLALAAPALALSPGSCPDRARTLAATGLGLEAREASFTVAFVRADVVVEVEDCRADWVLVDAGSAGRGWLALSSLAAVGDEPEAVEPEPEPEPTDDADASAESLEPAADAEIVRPQEGLVLPQRVLLLREQPSWQSPVAGRAPAGQPVKVLSGSENGWSLVEAGLDRPGWVVTAALHAPPLMARR